MKSSNHLHVLLPALIIGLALIGQAACAEESLQARSRYDYYTTESAGHLLVFVPESMRTNGQTVAVFNGDTACGDPTKVDPGSMTMVELDVGALPQGETTLSCCLLRNGATVADTDVNVFKRAPKANAVKIDQLTGGLIVDGLPFIPFGFYCYSPVQPTLAEEEVVKGFNLMSPYQDNEPDTLDARRAYMDRCAALGMKVHYQLLSVAGCGGVSGVSAEDAARRRDLLKAEVKAFRDHPALLAWYISDEPSLGKVAPELLTKLRGTIKDLDPYHPVTVVYMKPEAAREYANGMDIVMTDIYPVPNRPITEVDTATELLAKEFAYEKPLWFVPQAFGGGEWWSREPTPQELRAMTYCALINGSTGMQYFIRHGLNGFPKSTTAWAECGQLALETLEVTPAILSGEPRPKVKVSAPSVRAAAWRDRGDLVLLAVNMENAPTKMSLELDGVAYRGPADVLFENRTVEVKRRLLSRRSVVVDFIDGFGTRAYRIPLEPFSQGDELLHRRNRMVNPSFEKNPTVGVPAGCYANVGAGRGATYFVDSRVALHGRHSLRINVPEKDAGCSLGFYPIGIAKDRHYLVSVWAKAAPGAEAMTFGLSLGGLAEETFQLSSDWQEFRMEGPVDKEVGRTGVTLSVQDAGTAWFDLVQVVVTRKKD
ncbi:MAG: hypothetical protein GY851_18100 [bacterium]|nr:hypothetical protein [bacterium]